MVFWKQTNKLQIKSSRPPSCSPGRSHVRGSPVTLAVPVSLGGLMAQAVIFCFCFVLFCFVCHIFVKIHNQIPNHRLIASYSVENVTPPKKKNTGVLPVYKNSEFTELYLHFESLVVLASMVKHLKNSSTTNVCKFNTYPLLTYSTILPETSPIRTFLFGFLSHLPTWFLSCSVLFIIYLSNLSSFVH